MTRVALVVAIADNGVIGNAGKIPWRIADDMKHFKSVTLGKPCIMGRKTWESLPRKPLPRRANIVVTRDTSFAAEGAIITHSFDDALALARKENPNEIAVIGGADIYTAALPFATRIYLTEVHGAFDGDARFDIDRAVWREISREERVTADGLRYNFVTLERTKA